MLRYSMRGRRGKGKTLSLPSPPDFFTLSPNREPVHRLLVSGQVCSANVILLYTAISRKVVRKSARDNPERHCGWFWVHCSSEKFERIGTKGHEMCLRVLMERNKSRFDSYSRQEQCIDHIPYYLSGLSRAYFFRNSCIPKAVNGFCVT